MRFARRLSARQNVCQAPTRSAQGIAWLAMIGWLSSGLAPFFVLFLLHLIPWLSSAQCISRMVSTCSEKLCSFSQTFFQLLPSKQFHCSSDSVGKKLLFPSDKRDTKDRWIFSCTYCPINSITQFSGNSARSLMHQCVWYNNIPLGKLILDWF